MNDFVWQRKPWEAFKTFAIIFSFVMNFVLLLVLLVAAPLLLPIVDSIAKPLVGGLSESFVQMGDANIQRTIEVDDAIPVVFTLPLSTTTDVVLSEPVPLNVPAQFVLPDGDGVINGNVSLNLPAAMALPVQLDLQVPVSETVPVQLAVEVDIPLQETELGTPFTTLEELFLPLQRLIDGLPDSNDELFDRVGDSVTGPEPASEEISTTPK